MHMNLLKPTMSVANQSGRIVKAFPLYQTFDLSVNTLLNVAYISKEIQFEQSKVWWDCTVSTSDDTASVTVYFVILHEAPICDLIV